LLKKPEQFKKPGVYKKQELLKKPGVFKKHDKVLTPEQYNEPKQFKKPETFKKPEMFKKPSNYIKDKKFGGQRSKKPLYPKSTKLQGSKSVPKLKDLLELGNLGKLGSCNLGLLPERPALNKYQDARRFDQHSDLLMRDPVLRFPAGNGSGGGQSNRKKRPFGGQPGGQRELNRRGPYPNINELR
jgi:hypothetical protein